MLCQFERLIYPRSGSITEPNGYMIALYRPCEVMKDSIGNVVDKIKAVGYGLPISERLQYRLYGHWSKNQKHGVQFEVETFEEVIRPTKEGIISYLSSGQIKGIGPKLAERIFDLFGLETLNVLDSDPKKLLSVAGISENKLKKICDSYLANRGARDVVAFLAPHGVTPKRAVKLYMEYGKDTMDIVRNHPYKLCEIAGIGFKTADRIAQSMGIDRLSTERVDEGLLYTLAEAETRGHLCMEKREFIHACLKILDTQNLTEEMLAVRAQRLVGCNKLMTYQGNVYRKKAAYAEINLASTLCDHIRCGKKHCYTHLEDELNLVEKQMKVTFAAEQRQAVMMALTEPVSVITGGPGTGKTLIQKAILEIYRKNNPGREITCCAPTGRAARRMEQSTGHPASTVHRALGLLANEDDEYDEPQLLNGDLIVVDEVSMLDIYLAGSLVDSLKSHAQLILIGDADQLPSVGPGAVLSEIIASGRVPVVRLDKVFRQSKDNHIAVNARLIRHGNLSLEYGEDFQLIESPDILQSAEMITNLYLSEVNRYGIDQVALLTPFRKKTETGVNALNTLIRDQVNPPSEKKPQIQHKNQVFRCGDKVMQLSNHEELNNGDIGYIYEIVKIGDETEIRVDFGDGRKKAYEESDLEMLELGYASTIHKAQGAEYRSVIINLQCAHHIMLTRPLIYTAITRGKEKVSIVGERKALCIAIKRLEVEKRGTCLAKRIQEEP